MAETLEESVRWEVVGFANEDDVKLEHLAPWIPLKTGGWVVWGGGGGGIVNVGMGHFYLGVEYHGFLIDLLIWSGFCVNFEMGV